MPKKRIDFCVCEICILEKSLQVSQNTFRLRHIISLDQLSESRGWTGLFGVFNENLNTHSGFVYPNGFHLHKRASDSE